MTLVLTVACVVAALGSQSHTLSSQPAVPHLARVLYLLNPDADANAVTTDIRRAGGKVTHVFPGGALMAWVPGAMFPPHGVSLAYKGPVDSNGVAGARSKVAEVWNSLLTSHEPGGNHEPSPLDGAELVGDALVAPPPAQMQLLATADDPTPGFSETSEYFIGRVAVGIVLPESDGSADMSTEDWTEEERVLVLGKIVSALDWWSALEPRADLTFVYDDGTAEPTGTSFEPIARPYTDQSLWISEVMESKGHVSASYFDQVRQYNNHLRDTFDTDWAFTIFVVDSSNDVDDRFQDGYFAYSYVGGPFMVLTLGNNGYGTQNMDAVAAHEIGHVFGALDQYQTAHQPCSSRSGYLDVENQNSEYGECADDDLSIMRGGTRPYENEALDEYARGQVGWRDSDGDGILDPSDTTLTVAQIEVVTDVQQSNVFTVSGSLRDEPFPSPAGRDLIINEIESVQYIVAGDQWSDAQAIDGAFDTPREYFTFTTPGLPEGTWDVELRVRDSAGNSLTQTIATLSSAGLSSSSWETPTATAPDVFLPSDYNEDDLREEVLASGGGCDLGEETITDNLDATYTVLCDNQGLTDTDTGAIIAGALVETSLMALGSDVGGTELSPIAFGGQGSSSSGDVADIRYRLDDTPWLSLEPDDGRFDEPVEDFTLVLDPSDLTPGNHTVEVYAVDTNGNKDPSPATASFVAGQVRTRVYMPLVAAAKR